MNPAAGGIPIIDGGQGAQLGGAGQALSVIGRGGLVSAQQPQPIGRRLDQVQTRRRRMKYARSMKVLYHYLEGIYGCVDESKDMSMEFDSSYQKASGVAGQG